MQVMKDILVDNGYAWMISYFHLNKNHKIL